MDVYYVMFVQFNIDLIFVAAQTEKQKKTMKTENER
jgi:hypothetical protein